MVARRKYISPLVYWATEREAIRRAKEEGRSPPWTSDPILQKYRFCNVQRRDDRVSKWIISRVLNNYGFYDQWVFTTLVSLCRWINWPPTLDIILRSQVVTSSKIDLPKIGQLIENIVAEGNKAWTGAYMVRAPSKAKYPGITKGGFVSEIVVGGMNRFRVPLHMAFGRGSAKEAWEVLYAVPNWGSFMAGQVVADFSYTPLLSDAHDLNRWAPQGPGSKRGFNRLLKRPLKQKIGEDEWLERLQGWREEVALATGLPLNLMDLQNCLCEVDKYLRVQYGEGKPRSIYKPETAY